MEENDKSSIFEKIIKTAKDIVCNKKQILFIACGIVAAILVIILIITQNNRVYKKSTVEAGITVEVADFLKENDPKAYIVGKDNVDTTVPGKYKLSIKTGLFKHSVKLTVKDTIAPELTVKDIIVGYGKDVKPEDFVDKVSDATSVELNFSSVPDMKKIGEQNVEICVTDLGGNVTKKTAVLTVWPVENNIEVEAGNEFPSIDNFLLDDEITDDQFITDVSEISMNHVGDYYVDILVGDNEYSVKVKIVDSVAPEISVKNFEGYAIVKRSPEIFIEECNDSTDVTFTYESEPDFTRIGKQDAVIVATDEGGNSVKADVTLTLKEDTEAPVITGAEDIRVRVGDTISYRSFLKAEDNCMDDLKFMIDSSNVNVNQVGEYTVKCTATDAAGNSTTASFKVIVIESTYSQEEVYAMADAALAKCINSSMSEREKVEKIFWYIRGHLSYYDTGYHGNWLKGAGDAFTKGRGDCYSYACMSKAMLIRAGITNMDIERIPDGDNRHYWNLVDINDGHGWYHFDTTPRRNGNPTILLWTDSQMKEYSDANDNCFNYDRSLYPEIK